MESGSQEKGNRANGIRSAVREGRTSADQIIAGTRAARSGAGMNGWYEVRCDLCQGAGTVRFGTRPLETCVKCHGEGTLWIEDRPRAEIVATVQSTLFYLSMSLLAAALACGILIYVFTHPR
jgi:hypothetical protein